MRADLTRTIEHFALVPGQTADQALAVLRDQFDQRVQDFNQDQQIESLIDEQRRDNEAEQALDQTPDVTDGTTLVDEFDLITADPSTADPGGEDGFDSPTSGAVGVSDDTRLDDGTSSPGIDAPGDDDLLGDQGITSSVDDGGFGLQPLGPDAGGIDFGTSDGTDFRTADMVPDEDGDLVSRFDDEPDSDSETDFDTISDFTSFSDDSDGEVGTDGAFTFDAGLG